MKYFFGPVNALKKSIYQKHGSNAQVYFIGKTSIQLPLIAHKYSEWGICVTFKENCTKVIEFFVLNLCETQVQWDYLN